MQIEIEKMKTYIFEGYSDDTFGEYNETSIDYDNCGSGSPIRYKLEDGNENGVIIQGQYSPENLCGWMIGVGNIGKHKDSLDGWEFSLNPFYEGYRNQLTVTCPEDVKLVNLQNDEDSEEV